jgi:hypothetical protein
MWLSASCAPANGRWCMNLYLGMLIAAWGDRAGAPYHEVLLHVCKCANMQHRRLNWANHRPATYLGEWAMTAKQLTLKKLCTSLVRARVQMLHSSLSCACAYEHGSSHTRVYLGHHHLPSQAFAAPPPFITCSKMWDCILICCKKWLLLMKCLLRCMT